jgi:hypothetical protein
MDVNSMVKEFLLNELVELQEAVMFGVVQGEAVIYHLLRQGDLVVMLGMTEMIGMVHQQEQIID